MFLTIFRIAIFWNIYTPALNVFLPKKALKHKPIALPFTMTGQCWFTYIYSLYFLTEKNFLKGSLLKFPNSIKENMKSYSSTKYSKSGNSSSGKYNI